MPTVHTHDAFYLKENRYDQPKEIFKVGAAHARAAGRLVEGDVVADIGCAAGEFLYYLSKNFPGPKYAGYELLPELAEKARKMVPGVPFHTASVLDPNIIEPASLDVAFMIGVHSYFDDTLWLENLLRWVKPGGIAYVFGIFNPHPVDVFLKYRFAGTSDAAEGNLRPGWNYVSRRTVSDFIDSRLGPGHHRFIDFEMPFDIAQQDDPIRSWTMLDAAGRRWFTNGLCIIQHQSFLEIRPPKAS